MMADDGFDWYCCLPQICSQWGMLGVRAEADCELLGFALIRRIQVIGSCMLGGVVRGAHFGITMSRRPKSSTGCFVSSTSPIGELE